MKVTLSYDPSIDAWTLHHDQVRLESAADVAEWRRKMDVELKKLHGNPGYLLIDITGFEVSAVMMEEYGRTAKAVSRHFLAVLRHGASERTARAVLLQSIVNSYDPNLYPDREAAVSELRRQRAAGPARKP